MLAYPGHVNLADHSLGRLHVLQVFRQVNATPLAAHVRLDDERFRAPQLGVRYRLSVARRGFRST